MCTHRAPLSCPACDGTAADEFDAVWGDYGPVGEVCAGVGPDGQGCPRAAVAGPWCVEHSALDVEPLPIVPVLEVAA